MREIPETVEYFYKIKIDHKYLRANPNPGHYPNRNPSAIRIPHLRNSECVKLWEIAQYQWEIEINPAVLLWSKPQP